MHHNTVKGYQWYPCCTAVLLGLCTGRVGPRGSGQVGSGKGDPTRAATAESLVAQPDPIRPGEVEKRF